MKIAIVKLSALGDIVHSMIVLQFIKKQYPKSEIDWFAEKRFKGVLENNPHIDQVKQLNLKSAKESNSFFLFSQELRKIRNLGKYDLVVDMQGLVKSALVARMIPSDATFGFDKDSSRESLAAIFYDQKYKIDYVENVIERNLAIVAHALKFPFDQEDIRCKESFLFSSQKYTFKDISTAKKNIILIPGASYLAKRYPMEKFVDLTKKIDANFIIIWGNANERAIANEIKNQSANNHVNVSEALTFDALISLINQVDLVIGPDTGPTHMAWSLNVPSITLFGPTPGLRNTYTTKINKIIESESVVNPRKIDKNDYSIKNISVNQVVKISEFLLHINQ